MIEQTKKDGIVSAREDQQCDASTDLIAISVSEAGQWSVWAERAGLVTQLQGLFAAGHVRGVRGKSTLLYGFDGLPGQRLLVLGAGDPDTLSVRESGALARTLAEQALELGASRIACCLHGDPATLARHLQMAAYTPEGKTQNPAPTLLQAEFLCCDAPAAVAQGAAAGVGVNTTRRLADLPANRCTPRYLAEQAQALADSHPLIRCEVLDREAMAQLGMHSLLSVAQGSAEPPALIVLQYRAGAPDSAPTAIVGKGVTFDTGGISIKPSAAMDEMKYDMGGAAAGLGVVAALAARAQPLPINLVVVLPCVENMPSSTATRPGDVVTSLSGLTIEVLNTDAEGRLILCDALTYCARFQPAQVIDLATLTGACVGALGHHRSGVFGNDDDLVNALLAAGDASDDRAWRLPMDDDYDQELDSRFADIANIASVRWGGASHAACFLSRFCKDYRWAHLDIAGTAWQGGKNKGASGRPVPLLLHYLDQLAANHGAGDAS